MIKNVVRCRYTKAGSYKSNELVEQCATHFYLAVGKAYKNLLKSKLRDQTHDTCILYLLVL